MAINITQRNAWYIEEGTVAGVSTDKNYHYGLAIRLINSEEDAIANNRSIIEVTHAIFKDWGNAYNLNDNTSWYKLDGGNQVNVITRYDLSSKANGTWFKAGYDTSIWTKGSSTTYTINHNADGTKSSIVSGYFNANNPGYWTSGSANVTVNLPTIPRASTVDAVNGNIGSATTIQIVRLNSSFKHKLYYQVGNIAKTLIAENVDATYTWNIPTSIYAQIPNSNAAFGYVIVETYNGATLIGTSQSVLTAKVVNSNPIYASKDILYYDNDSNVVAITGNNQQIVQNQSLLSFAFGDAVAMNSATMSKYEITFNGSTQTFVKGSTIDYGKINLSDNTTISIKAIDSRGNSTTISKAITVLPWINPSAIIVMQRKNNYEDATLINVDGTISSVDSKNSMTLSYQYKKTTESTYSNEIFVEDNVDVIVSFDKSYSYDVRFNIKDKFASTVINKTLSKGIFTWFVDVIKRAVGINRFPRANYALDIVGNFGIDGVIEQGSVNKVFYNVAEFADNKNSSVTGAIVIDLPFGWNSTMLEIELDIYNYGAQVDDLSSYSKILVGGYNYSEGAWYSTAATVLGSLPTAKIQMGYNISTGKCCIRIGDENTVWNYLKVNISKVIVTYANVAYDWSNDWIISLRTDTNIFTHMVDANKWKYPVLQGTWLNYDNGAYYAPSRYKKINGIVYLSGLLKNISNSESLIFRLPVGYRPSKVLIFTTRSNQADTRVDVFPDGGVVFITGNTGFLSLDGMYFISEQ